MVKKQCEDDLLLAAHQGTRRLRRRFCHWIPGALRPLAAMTDSTRGRARPGPLKHPEGLFPKEPEIMSLDRSVGNLPGPVLEPALQCCPPLGRIERPGLGLEGP